MSWLYIVSSVSWRATPRTVMFMRTKRRVVVGYGLSEEFKVNIGLRQGNAPLLFIMVVALISRKFSKKDVLRKGMYANDLAMIADKKQELQEVLQEWKGGVQEGRTDNEPGEDRRDVGLTSERGFEHYFG